MPDVLTLEEAVARLTSIAGPGPRPGRPGRPRRRAPRPTSTCIDPDRLAAADAPRYVRDFPAGSGRFVVDAEGYVATVVNGEVLLEDGAWTGATPGAILRP